VNWIHLTRNKKKWQALVYKEKKRRGSFGLLIVYLTMHFSYSYYVASNEGMISKCSSEMDVRGSGHVLIFKVLSTNLSGGTEKNYEKPQSG
jgi:hypothetical protein